jgi:hemin uptake protein HemP
MTARKTRPPAPDAAPATQPTVDSRQLLGPDGRLRIRHGEQVYELRRTRFDKLILTK